MILKQVFIHGFFHADLHAGNVLVLKDDIIGLVDFGIVGHFSEDLRKKSIDIFYGIVEEDPDIIIETFLEMGMVDQNIDMEEFRKDIKNVIEPLQKSTLEEVEVSHVLEEVLDIALHHHIRLPLDFVLFGKAVVEIEGVALECDPSFKFVDNAKPFLEKLIRKEINIGNMPNEIMKTVMSMKKFLQKLPKETTKTLKKIQEGKVTVDIEDTDIGKLSEEIDKSSNRIAYSMVIAALIVAGALTVNVDLPKIFDLPWVSFLSFSAAGILGIFLLFSILKEK
jgi:ubiquinone biosynthesis protein